MMNDNSKVIITYRGGSKGDLLCNFLNNCLTFETNNRNTIYHEHHPIRCQECFLQVGNKEKISNDLLDLIPKIPVTFTNSHVLDSFPLDFIKKLYNNHSLFFLNSEDYYRNAYLDTMFKRCFDLINNNDRILLYSKKIKNFSVKYKIDLYLLKIGYTEITNDVRIKVLKDMFSNLPASYIDINKESKNYFNEISYKDVFFPPFDDMKKLMKYSSFDLNLDDWQQAVIKSYLPKKINVFGEDFNPADYGYIWHYE